MSNYFIERDVEIRIQEALRYAEKRRLLRLARGDQRGWLARTGCWLLGQLGRLLIAAGQRLEHYGRPTAVPLNRSGGAFPGNGEMIF